MIVIEMINTKTKFATIHLLQKLNAVNATVNVLIIRLHYHSKVFNVFERSILLSGFATMWTGLEVAAKNIAKSVAAETVTTVKHK